jgi:hypothetical protein
MMCDDGDVALELNHHYFSCVGWFGVDDVVRISIESACIDAGVKLKLVL